MKPIPRATSARAAATGFRVQLVALVREAAGRVVVRYRQARAREPLVGGDRIGLVGHGRRRLGGDEAEPDRDGPVLPGSRSAREP